MKTIRRNVFETNSSSTHSISIAVDKFDSTITPNEEGNVVLCGGEFGWEQERYYDPLTKANYCAVDCFDFPDKLDMLFEAIKEVTNCKEVILDFTKDWDDDFYSYIDHQSDGTVRDELFSVNDFKNFIFNSDSYLETDNDNH